MTAFLNHIKRILKRRGNDNFSLVTVSSVNDPTDPLNVINTETIESLVSWQGNYKDDKIDGTIIKDTDIKLYVDPSSISTTIKVNDKITNGTDTYTIKSLRTWKSGDTIHLYILKLRI